MKVSILAIADAHCCNMLYRTVQLESQALKTHIIPKLSWPLHLQLNPLLQNGCDMLSMLSLFTPVGLTACAGIHYTQWIYLM